MNNVLKLSVEQESKIIAEFYTKSVWNKYYPVVGFISELEESEWKIYPQYLAFVEESKTIATAPNLLKAEVYTQNSKSIFRSNDSIFTEKTSFFSLSAPDKEKSAIKEALAGKHISFTIQSAQINNNGKVSQNAVLKTFIPLEVTNIKQGTESLASKAAGTLELSFDVTDTIKDIETFQFALVFLIIATLAILTAAVFISSQKAEALIEKQQDVSLEMASARTLAEAESKAKSQFLANVSHELRTPLNAIIGFSEIISSEAMGPINNNQYKEFIKDIHTSGVHLLSLINDILDFSKAEENKLQVDFEQVDLVKIAKVCVRMVLPRAEQTKVQLKEDISADHIILSADPKRLKQCILNLLSNSVKFTPENGEVGIKIAKSSDASAVIIEIHDTGIGMAAQDLARALAPFSQVDNKLSRKYEGTGLGLPITKKLVELMKGKFDIKSEPGLGTTVTITMPLSREETSDDGQKLVDGIKPTSLVAS